VIIGDLNVKPTSSRCNAAVFLQHLSQRLSEHLVARSVDDGIDTDADEPDSKEHVHPSSRQPYVLITVLNVMKVHVKY